MQRLRTTSESAGLVPADEILEALLVEAGAADVLPTNEHKLLTFLGLRQLSFDFMHELDFLQHKEIERVQLRAALSLQDRLVATQTGMGEKRTRFCMFHEIGHCVLPEHHEKLFVFVDTDQTLSWWTKARLEREANQFAADLLFQGNRFTEEALGSPLSLQVAVELAPKYGASFEAAFRRYTERHVVPCALIVYDKVARQEDQSFIEDDEYRLQYTITSPAFRKLYFAGQLEAETCRASDVYKVPWRIGEVVESDVAIEGDRASLRFTTQVFSNAYKIFQFLLRPA